MVGNLDIMGFAASLSIFSDDLKPRTWVVLNP